MAKLSITLKDKNGDAVTYSEDKVPAKKVLDFWDLQAKIESDDDSYTPKQYLLDRIEFCASLFSAKQVTSKAILESLNAWELEETIDDLILTAVGVKKEVDPKLMDLVQQAAENVS